MYIFQKKDNKYDAWSRELADIGIQTIPAQGSPIKAPLVIFRLLFRGKITRGYFFRYLNDYPSLWKTILRLVSELFVIFLLKLMRGSVFWIVHNIDKESSGHHQILSHFRRWIVSCTSKAIFITDPLLEKHALQKFPSEKITWTCFGRPSDNINNKHTIRVQSQLKNLRTKLMKENPEKTVYIGLCVSSASTKCTHFLTVCDFIDRNSTNTICIGVLMVGAVGRIKDPRFKSARIKMMGHGSIGLIDEAIPVKEKFLKDDVDFFYRGLSDLSVSYSLYVAASVRKPMITHEGLFLAEMVKHYGLGLVIASNQENEPSNFIHKGLENWNPENADIFLAIRNWKTAASQFKSKMILHGVHS